MTDEELMDYCMEQVKSYFKNGVLSDMEIYIQANKLFQLIKKHNCRTEKEIFLDRTFDNPINSDAHNIVFRIRANYYNKYINSDRLETVNALIQQLNKERDYLHQQAVNLAE